jgi:hypothetical protein
MTPEMVPPIDPPEACILVLTNSIGWVKFTANAAARPPHAMDSKRFGFRGWDMVNRVDFII